MAKSETVHRSAWAAGFMVFVWVCVSFAPCSMAQQHRHRKEDTKPLTASRSKRDKDVFGQRVDERQKMVKEQIVERGIKDPNVVRAMLRVPRHVFVREGDSRHAYRDNPLPIGNGQTISQPYIVAYMTEILNLDADSRVLEIGTGSGYQAAVCAEIAREVYTIEIIEALAESAEKRLDQLGYANISVKAGDGYWGWPEKGPFDTIIVTAAAGIVPPDLIKQLKGGGKMVLPLGSPYGWQVLVLVTKDKDDNVSSKQLLPVRFVPMVGQVTRSKR